MNPQPNSPSSRATYLPKGESAVSYPLQTTALLVIDPVNDFLSEGGAGWELTKSTVELHDVVGNLKKLIAGARERGIPVLFGPMAYTKDDYATHQLQRRSGINRIMFEKKMFLAGSWGADFHPDLQPLGDEVVLLPHKTCDVFTTDLPAQLQRLGTTHLVIAGMAANLCCESTGRRAVEEGYDVTYISNAIGAESMPAYEAAVLVNFPLLSNAVLEVAEFLAAVDAAAPSALAAQPGDRVFGSDHLEIGTIGHVVAGDDDTEGHLHVSSGLIFHTDTYIPLDAVAKRSGTDVFINVPKIVVGTMPWSQPPTPAGRRAKSGPPAQEAGALYGSRSPSALERPVGTTDGSPPASAGAE
ncbi:isochorismatase family protein [Hymenobacter sp. B1770]|uniref:isochorismatase family protein n=1 Tax=Hymenobacter sp. B1770 TaxID=1718788 RepID=UPI003CEEE53B